MMTHTRRLALIALVPVLVLTMGAVAPRKVTVKAQSLPVTRQIAWDQNGAVAEGIIDFTVTFDGVTRTVTAAVACTPDPQKCQTPQVFATTGTHSLTVTANSLWGSSAPAALTVVVTLPHSPSGITIK